MYKGTNNILLGDDVPPAGQVLADRHIKPHGYKVIRPNGSNNYILFFTIYGRGEFDVGDTRFVCEPGELIILQQGIPQRYATAPDHIWDFVWAHVNPDERWAPLLARIKNGFLQLRIVEEEKRKRLLSAFERLISDLRTFLPYQEYLVDASVQEIVFLAVQSSEQTRESQWDPRVHDVYMFLKQNYSRKITIKEISERACLSISRLSHLFKEQTGYSLKETLLSIRLREASLLLIYTLKSISEIAEEVGIPNHSFFSKMFLQHYGNTPAAYRKVIIE